DRAVPLVYVDGADLADGAGGPRRAVSEPAVVRALDLRHRRLDRSIEQVDGVGSVEGNPLAIVDGHASGDVPGRVLQEGDAPIGRPLSGDRKSTRLNSSHRTISYAVFC